MPPDAHHAPEIVRADAPRAPWGRALLVVGVIGVAHLALFLLLTASARKEVSALEERYGASALANPVDPGARPRDSGSIPDWLRAQQVWEAGRTYATRTEYVSLLGYGLLLSFLVQAAILGVLLARSVQASGGRRSARG